MYSIHLFAGAGGGILGDLLLGHTPICAVEIEKYPQRVLLQRQLDGILPAFPIWDDVTTFRSDNPECSDFFARAKDVSHELVICGGFPCQDISSAGKGAGITGSRSGLWKEFARIIEEVRPAYCFIENSPLLRTRGLEVVLEDLASLGFDAEWGVIGASHVGAPHKRDRIWVVAHANGAQCERRRVPSGRGAKYTDTGLASGAWETEPRLDRVVDGVAHRVDRLKAIGNGQVPRVAEVAWQILSGRMYEG